MLKIVSILFLFISLLLASCARPRVEMPVYEGVGVRDVLDSKKNISSIEASFSISFEKGDMTTTGDGVLNISRNGDMNMRIYRFGFLAFQISSEDGVIKSSPPVDRGKAAMLTYGLRDCLFWWDLKDFGIEEKENSYVLKDMSRTLWIDRKTMFPMRQVISLEDGNELDMSYEDPEKAGDIWYPAKITIELSRYSVTLKIKDISFITGT
jgi:outer membrane lipoprotein-sorting protein